MRAVVQRIKSASVSIDQQIISSVGPGLLVFLGIARGDGPEDVSYLSDKIANLRVFEDKDGKMNRSVADISGEILIVSQFTLYGDCRKGRRPSFAAAAGPETAERLYDAFTEKMRAQGIPVRTGVFRAMMAVSLVNDGPVTLIIESNADCGKP